MKRSFRKDLRRSLRYLRPHYRPIAWVLLLTLGAGAVPAFEPLVNRTVFDRLTAGARPEMRALLAPVILLAVLVVARLGLEAASSLLAWRVRLRVHRALLAETTGRLHTLPIAYHQERGVGDTMTRIDRGINSFVEGLSSVAFQLIPSFVYLLISFGIMLHLSPTLALLATGFILPPLVLSRSTTQTLVERERVQLQRWCGMYNRFQQVLSGIKTVKVCAQEADEHARLVSSVEGAHEETLSCVGLQTRLSVGRNVWINVGRVAVLGVGGVLVARGNIGVGTLVAFLGYVGGLYGPAQTLLGLYETLRRAELGLDAIFGVLDAEDAVPDAPGAHVPSSIQGHIEFERVTFRHDPGSSGAPALDGVSLRIEAGEFVAVVGPSGAGKSTFADLILRLHDPTEGAVRIDGRDLRGISQIGLRRHIGVVTQEPFLFEDSIEANIRYGSPAASADDVRAAARAARVDAFIRRLPDGYRTLVGRGGIHLSGGERQRIAIARTLLRDPRVVVLDEPTSALDVEGEVDIQQAIERLAGGRTTIMIAHRLASTAHADRVLVIEKGRLVEQGSPAALLDRDGPYRRLMRLSKEPRPRVTRSAGQLSAVAAMAAG
jgi:ATP-binding cassette subfamily B protein